MSVVGINYVTENFPSYFETNTHTRLIEIKIVHYTTLLCITECSVEKRETSLVLVKCVA